jgi:hypothetical protein
MAQDNSKKIDPIIEIGQRLAAGETSNDPIAQIGRQQNQTSSAFKLDPAMAKRAQESYQAIIQKNAEDQQAVADSQNLALKILGDQTLIGGTLRLITAAGRGIANAEYEVLDEVNKMGQLRKDIDAGRRPDDYLQQAVPLAFKAAGDALGGFRKGFLGSLPFGKEIINQQDPTNPVKEGWYDVLSSERFAETAKLNPALEFARDERDLGWGNIPFFNVPYTSAGLTSFTLDTFLDPASYVSLGIAGSVRGIAQGTSQLSKASKALAKGALEPELFVPKNVQGFRVKGVKGKQYTARPLPSGRTAATVVQDNRGVASFIFENATQGFLDVHRNALARTQAKWATRSAKLAAIKASILGQTTPNLEATPEQIAEQIISNESNVDNIIKILESKGQPVTEVTDESLRQVKEDLANEIAAIYREAQDPAVRQQRLDELQQVTDEASTANVDLESEVQGRLAIAELLRTSPLVPTTVKNKFVDNPKLISDAARGLESGVVLGGKIAGGDSASIGTVWRGIIEKGGRKEKIHTIAAMFLPPNYRAIWAKEIADSEKAGAAATGNIVANFWGLNLLAKGKRKTAKVDNEYQVIREHIRGTGITRAKSVRKESAEMNALMGEAKRISDLINGPGSKLTKGRRALFNADEVATRFLDDQLALGKAWYDEQVAKGAISGVDVNGNPVEWSDLTLQRQAQVISDLLEDPDLITPEMLDKVGLNPILVASRLSYLAKRAVATETVEYQTIKRLQRKLYNPATAVAQHIKTSQMWVFGERAGAPSFTQIKRAIRTVKGVRLSTEAKRMLRAEGLSPSKLRKDGSTEFRSPYEIEEILKASVLRQAVREADANLQTLVNDLKAAFPEDADMITAESFSPKMTKAQKQQLKAFGNALTEAVTLRDEKIAQITKVLFPDSDELEKAVEVLRQAGVDADYRGHMLTMAVMQTGRIFSRDTKQQNKGLDLLDRIVKEIPRVKNIDGPIIGREVFGDFALKLDKLTKNPNVPKPIVDAGNEIYDMLMQANVFYSKIPFTLQEMNAFSSKIGTILTKARANQARGRVGLFDELFIKDNTLDRQGLGDFVYRAYLASRGAKAEDEGLFADFVYGKLIATIRETGSSQNLNEATPEQLKNLIKETFADWDGEGLTIDILQDVARETAEKGTTKIPANVAARIENETKQAVMSAKQSVAEDLINVQQSERIVRELEAEMTGEGVAFLDQGFDRLPRAITENETEEAIAREAIQSASYTLSEDAAQKLRELLSTKQGFDAVTKNTGFRVLDEKGKPVSNIADIKEGHSLKYSGIKQAFSTELERYDIQQLENKISELVTGSVGEAAEKAAKASLAKLEAQRDKINEALAGEGMTQPGYRPAVTERVYTKKGDAVRQELLEAKMALEKVQSFIDKGKTFQGVAARSAQKQAELNELSAKISDLTNQLESGKLYKEVTTPEGDDPTKLVPTQRARDLRTKLQEVNTKIDQISKQRFKGIPEAEVLQQRIQVLRKLIQDKNQLGIKMWKIGQAAAIRDVQLHRAEEVLKSIWPKWANSEELIQAGLRTGNTLTARAHIRAKLMLASILAKVDRGIEITDLKEQATRRTGADFKKEREQWAKILDKLAAKVTKMTGAKMPDLSEKQLAEVSIADLSEGGKYADNPLVLIEKIRTFEVNSGEQKEDWDTLLQLLLNKGIADESAGQRYPDLATFFGSYTRQDVTAPTMEEVVTVLERMGSGEAAQIAARIRAGEKPRANRRSILRLINAVELNKDFNLQEAMAKLGAAVNLNLAGGNEIDDILEQMAPDADIVDDIANTYSSEINTLIRAGQEDILRYVEIMDGREMNQFVVQRQREGVSSFKDALGRTLDSNKPGKSKEKDAWSMMRSFEPQTQYTGYKEVLSILDIEADRLGLVRGEINRAQYIDAKMAQIQRLSDLRKLRYGIVPSINIKLTSDEGRILGMFRDTSVNKDAIDELESAYPGLTKEVMLSLSDIKLSLPVEARQLLFYMGPKDSIPETALAPAVRLLIGMRSMLPAGQTFDPDTVKYVAKSMLDLMVASIKKTSVSKNGGPSVLELDPEGTYNRLQQFIKLVMDPARTDDLYTRHIINSAINIKSLRHKTGALTKPHFDKLYKALDSVAGASGDRLQATVELTKAINAITKSKIDPVGAALIEHDLHSALIANMTMEDYNVFVDEWLKETTEELTGEAGEIAKVIAAGRKVPKKQQAILVQSMKRKSQLFDNMLQASHVKEVDANGLPTRDKVEQMTTNHEASIGQVNWLLKWVNGFDRVLGALFYAHGADTIAPALTGPAQRLAQEQVTTYSRFLEELSARLSGIPYEGNLAKDAFNILKTIPLDVFRDATHAMTELQKRVAKKTDTPITGDEAATLMEDMKKLDQYFDTTNPALRTAVTYMGHALAHIFGGGRHSLVVSAGLDPKWLQRNLLEVGGYDVGFKFTGTKVDDIVNSWKEADPENPIEMLRLIHAALKRAEIVPQTAANLTLKFGVPKSNYKNYAEAKADGLYDIPNQDYISTSPATETSGNMIKTKTPAGRELVYFMDTENYYYPAMYVNEIYKVAADLTATRHFDFQTPAIQKIVRGLDKVQNEAKRFMTIFRPANFAQSTMGGFWTNFLAGMTSPLRYRQSAAVLGELFIDKKALKEAGIEIDKLDKMLAVYERNAASEGLVIKETTKEGSKTIPVRVNGRVANFKVSDLAKLYAKLGGRVTTSQVFDPLDDPAMLKSMTTMKQARVRWEKMAYGVGKGAATRDDFFRLALWIDELIKEGGDTLTEAGQRAMAKVDRYHPQAQDLSAFNQKYSKRANLFFTWKAKSLAWVLMDILDKPGVILATLHAQYNRQKEEGQDVQFGDFTPANANLPSYYQNNLNPTTMVDGSLYSFSQANPVMDLLGGSSWLGGISINTYEPVPDQLARITANTWKNVVTSADPIFVSMAIDWGWANKTMRGEQLSLDNGIEDIFGRLGLDPAYALLAASMPDIFKRAKWQGMSEEQISKDQMIQLTNFITGLRIKEVGTLQDSQKAFSELLQKIKKLQGLD